MVEKVRLIHLCVFREIQQIVDIRVAVCEGREEKTVFRCADHPVLHAVFNRIVGHIVAETRFVEFYRADAAEDKFIDVIGSIVQILSDGTGEGAFKNLKIFKHFFLFEREKRFF